jgi:hypothetical protein
MGSLIIPSVPRCQTLWFYQDDRKGQGCRASASRSRASTSRIRVSGPHDAARPGHSLASVASCGGAAAPLNLWQQRGDDDPRCRSPASRCARGSRGPRLRPINSADLPGAVVVLLKNPTGSTSLTRISQAMSTIASRTASSSTCRRGGGVTDATSCKVYAYNAPSYQAAGGGAW